MSLILGLTDGAEVLGDVTFASDSGHDYAVPEPGQGTLLALSAALLLRSRKPRPH